MIDAVVVAAANAWTQSDKMTYWIILVPFGLNVRAETRQLFFPSHIVLMKSQRSS